MKVFIEGVEGPNRIAKMFDDRGWEVMKKDTEADLIVFSGGSDVSPMLYDCPRHPKSLPMPARDEACFELWWKHLYEKPMAGICRGAQFLNVVNGGEMFQHVEKHALGGAQTHTAKNMETDVLFQVTSTHHQMMIPPPAHCEVLVEANLGGDRQFFDDGPKRYKEDLADVEAIWCWDSNSLCYQPHPEYVLKDHKCQSTFFEFIDEYLYF